MGQIIAHTRQGAEGGDPGRKARLLQPLCPVRSGEVGLHIPYVVRNGQSRPPEALLCVGGGVRQIQLIHGHVPGPFRLPQGKAVIARPQDQVLPGAACGGLLQRLLSKGCTGQGQRPQLGVDDMGQGFLLRAGKIRREKADARRHCPAICKKSSPSRALARGSSKTGRGLCSRCHARAKALTFAVMLVSFLPLFFIMHHLAILFTPLSAEMQDFTFYPFCGNISS